jgi:hypothetical protein
MTYFSVLYLNLPRRTEENHREPWSGYLMPKLRFELRTSLIQSRSSDHYCIVFGDLLFNLHSVS